MSRPALGLLGGTFDPVHRAHLEFARAARRHLSLERVLLIPAARPPLKDDCQTAAEHRYRMVERAVAGEPHLDVCDIELRRRGPSYTADTLEELQAQHPDTELWFLIGTDALLQLEAWHEPDRVLALASLGVVTRSTTAAPHSLAGWLPARFASQFGPSDDGWLHHSGHRLSVIPFDPLPISSSQIREFLRAGKSVADWLPDGVIDYIHSHRLYQEDS